MITFSSGAFFEETELGVCTVTAVEGFGLAVKIKKDNKRKATSHIAVISTDVLFLAIFGLAIV